VRHAGDLLPAEFCSLVFLPSCRVAQHLRIGNVTPMKLTVQKRLSFYNGSMQRGELFSKGCGQTLWTARRGRPHCP
jgi:hypothetical protein